MESDNRNKKLLELTLLEFLNSFSILVVLGSISSSYFFVRLFRSDVHLLFYWILASTVWVIYTTDHLIDGYRNKDQNISLRHALHYQYRKVLGIAILILVPSNLYLAFHFLGKSTLFYGFLLALFVLTYILLIPVMKKLNKWVWKELLVAIGVSGGMLLIPGLAGTFNWSFSDLLLISVFTLINLLNLVIFAMMDHDEDSSSGMVSVSAIYGEEKTTELANNLVVITYLMLGIWLYSFDGVEKMYVTVVLLLMLNILGVIVLKKDHFAKHGLYRFWGDFIYLVPGLIQLIFVDKVI